MEMIYGNGKPVTAKAITEKSCGGRSNCGLGAILRGIDQQTLRTLESFTLADAASSGAVGERLVDI